MVSSRGQSSQGSLGKSLSSRPLRLTKLKVETASPAALRQRGQWRASLSSSKGPSAAARQRILKSLSLQRQRNRRGWRRLEEEEGRGPGTPGQRTGATAARVGSRAPQLVPSLEKRPADARPGVVTGQAQLHSGGSSGTDGALPTETSALHGARGSSSPTGNPASFPAASAPASAANACPPAAASPAATTAAARAAGVLPEGGATAVIALSRTPRCKATGSGFLAALRLAASAAAQGQGVSLQGQ